MKSPLQKADKGELRIRVSGWFFIYCRSHWLSISTLKISTLKKERKKERKKEGKKEIDRKES